MSLRGVHMDDEAISLNSNYSDASAIGIADASASGIPIPKHQKIWEILPCYQKLMLQSIRHRIRGFSTCSQGRKRVFF
ncbi:MAG: hypothetical protein ACE5K2_07470, partial [Candidatus Zixiibacteriota bacterium]